MQRSSSTQRASEFFLHGSSSPKVRSPSDSVDEVLPLYDPQSDFVKREKLRAKFSENAVHVIPLVLVMCAVVLWFFSNPEVDMMNKDRSIAARIEGLTIDGDIEVTSSKTGLLEDLDELDPPQQKQDATNNSGRSSDRLF